MTRCAFCRRRVWPWPWVHIGWYIALDGRRYSWHPRCFRAWLRGDPDWDGILSHGQLQRILDEVQA
jgi:hypothetical protein